MNAPCRESELLLAEYASGDLPPEAAQRIETHLACCPACAEELARELRLRELLGSLPVRRPERPAPTAPLAGALAGAVTGRRALRWTLAASAAAAMLAFAMLIGDIATPPPGPLSGAGAEPSDWTPQEIRDAQDDLEYSLALTARLLKKSGKTAVTEVFGDHLPRVINESLQKAIHTNQGDQG